MSTLIKNGRIITADQDYTADIYIERDTITTIGGTLPQHADTVIDAGGKYVIPGGIDVHTHMELPFGGTFAKDTFETGSRAAAFGGTTTIVDFAVQTKGKSPKDFLAAAEKVTGLEFKGEDRTKIVSTKTLSAALMRYTSIGWTSNNHTGEMVEFCSYGPGSELFTPHLRNDQVHAKILRAAGLA